MANGIVIVAVTMVAGMVLIASSLIISVFTDRLGDVMRLFGLCLVLSSAGAVMIESVVS